MKIKMLVPACGPNFSLSLDGVYELEDQLASALIKAGSAEVLSGQVETAEAESSEGEKVETAEAELNIEDTSKRKTRRR